MMKNPLKYAQHWKVKKDKPKALFLWEESVRHSGVVNVEHNIFTTHDKEKHTIFQYDYHLPYGLDESIDESNDISTLQLVNGIEANFKICFMSEVKASLNKNIAMFEDILDKTEDETRCDLIERHLDVMRFYNEERSISQFIDVESKYRDIVTKNGQGLALEQLTYEGLIKHLEKRNNGLE